VSPATLFRPAHSSREPWAGHAQLCSSDDELERLDSPVLGNTIGPSNKMPISPNDTTAARSKGIAKRAIHAVSLLVLLFLFHNQALGADTPDALRQRILAGDQIYFSVSAPENTRTINANWIKEAVINHVRVQIHERTISERRLSA
jgi:hypothetical protein